MDRWWKKSLITITICVNLVRIPKSYRISAFDLTEHYCKSGWYSCSNSVIIVAEPICKLYCLRGRIFFNSINFDLFVLQPIGFITAILQYFLSYFYCPSLNVASNGIDTSATNCNAALCSVRPTIRHNMWPRGNCTYKHILSCSNWSEQGVIL